MDAVLAQTDGPTCRHYSFSPGATTILLLADTALDAAADVRNALVEDLKATAGTCEISFDGGQGLRSRAPSVCLVGLEAASRSACCLVGEAHPWPRNLGEESLLYCLHRTQ
jgi:hypothetical protein